MKSCSTCKPPESHQASPIRNAYVPVPPESPVVSVSRNSHFVGSESAASVRLESSASRERHNKSRVLFEASTNSGVEYQLLTETCSP